jgi:hypothetical protein
MGRSLLFAAIPFFALFLAAPQTPIAAFETTAAGTLEFPSTLPQDGSDNYEDLEVTARAESTSADRQR